MNKEEFEALEKGIIEHGYTKKSVLEDFNGCWYEKRIELGNRSSSGMPEIIVKTDLSCHYPDNYGHGYCVTVGIRLSYHKKFGYFTLDFSEESNTSIDHIEELADKYRKFIEDNIKLKADENSGD